MKAKIVSVFLVALLMGLVLSGCVSKAELDECKALVTDQVAQIEGLEAQVENQTAQIAKQATQIGELESQSNAQEAQVTELEGKLNEKVAQIAQLEEEKAGFEAEIECLRQPPPEKVSGEIVGYISYKETVEVTRKFFWSAEVGGDIAGSSRRRYPLVSVETLKQFLANYHIGQCVPCRPSSYDNCDHFAFRLRAYWIDAGFSRWSLGLAKVEIDTQYGRMLCWRLVFLTKEKGEFVFYEVDPRTHEVTTIEESSAIYRVVRISDRL